MKFGTGVLYRKLSSERDFRENRLFDSPTVHENINYSLRVIFIYLDILG